MNTIRVIPFAVEARRQQSRKDLLDILATVQFWRTRAVEFTFLSTIVFYIGFEIARRL
ncbi:Hypothetical protein RG1141_CH01420 [Neorhizobium galegae bv. officinalis bv. officinalis str. HAMBI 1141]|jgi:hypothetical protein|uniref:Uncharacterized protein n=1 Tax=Neorhizobium galegae bv. officinalis bv. officinalis str. HAMBI 1141 TaxID=1028801 RepID=A0A068T228_NEOGA|nr:hypothetical protein [Neorhizobium galegae]CDN52507.1 Hypothetical protein RG1141_CH01420 [Neorhizobium galegae bv. officinalis bv. officinalis str. HAMBI 1141]